MKSHLKEGSSLGRMGSVYGGEKKSASVESLKCAMYCYGDISGYESGV
jgi:hypothetical protein